MHTTAQPAGTDFLQQLRQETGPMHRQLEQNPLSASLMRDDVSLTDYANYLARMYPVVKYCEETIFPLVEELMNVDERRKLSHMEKDLEALGVSPVTETFAPDYAVDNMSAALGVMYVIEGSTLGGKVILKHLAGRHPISENNYGRFMYGYGEETGKRWKDFLQVFTAYIAEHNSEAETIGAAKAMFASIDRFFA